jgi:hypothetical protein
VNLKDQGQRESKVNNKKKMEAAAVASILEMTKSGEFLLKMGKNVSEVTEKYQLTRAELFAMVFDDILKKSSAESAVEVGISVKYPDPRVTLLTLHKNEGMEIFKEKFVNMVVRYLTSEKSLKPFNLILTLASNS